MQTVLQWVSKKRDTLPAFSSRAEFSYCKQNMENYMARDSQWELINDIYPSKSGRDLKCVPINLADCEGMTTIELSLNVDIYTLTIYDTIREGVQNGIRLIFLLPVNIGKTQEFWNTSCCQEDHCVIVKIITY